ncbi:potassium transporter TrkA [Saccharomonospora sp. CUA-673]|uniref:potassium channel family protein n=1 Tax=Saccharomonospora sp. CUA-673 TaxID=1904969 RepID=UPI000969A36C|nr:TrkA family potassium uptake protein [Saccharomonospora sp. CUA-673]OLT43061.1 potassium transporter TrkA [Saccharomonospora sp. CUA-673]
MRVAIAGAGAVGRSIAAELIDSGHAVLLIERLSHQFTPEVVEEAEWVLGDACEMSTLELRHRTLRRLIAATGDDKANLVIALLAKTEFAVQRVVARVNNPANEWLFNDSWGVDVAVSTPRMLAAMVEEAVNVGDLVRLMTFRKSQSNLVELTLPDETPLAGTPVQQLHLPKDAALVAILRGERVIVPQPDDPVEGGDELLFVASTDVEPELRAALGREERR